MNKPPIQTLCSATLARARSRLEGRVGTPAYRREDHGVGIVHLGLGAFHRAHQAVCTDDAIAASGGHWRIVGVSPRSTSTADAINVQDGLFTVLSRDGASTRGRVIGSIAEAVATRRHPDRLHARLSDRATRIVSLTVTEKAYSDTAPGSAIATLVDGLAARRDAGLEPYTVLCCDNLESNGDVVRRAVIAHAAQRDTVLAHWIDENGAFPSSMVDRIVPAATDSTRQEAQDLLGLTDQLAVETEPFFQWVMEDRFVSGRPDWEAGGAIFVDDVTPWETAKLTMLNGAHTLIACLGMLLNGETVADTVAVAPLRALVKRHMDAAAACLPTGGPEPEAYRNALLARFDNVALHHRTAQIAVDSSEKVPRRWLGAAGRAAQSGQQTDAFAFAFAVWLRWCEGRDESGSVYAINDPRADVLARLGSTGAGGRDRVDAMVLALGWEDQPFFQGEKERECTGAMLDKLHNLGVAEAARQHIGAE